MTRWRFYWEIKESTKQDLEDSNQDCTNVCKNWRVVFPRLADDCSIRETTIYFLYPHQIILLWQRCQCISDSNLDIRRLKTECSHLSVHLWLKKNLEVAKDLNIRWWCSGEIYNYFSFLFSVSHLVLFLVANYLFFWFFFSSYIMDSSHNLSVGLFHH